MRSFLTHIKYTFLRIIKLHRTSLLSDFLNFLGVSSLTFTAVTVLFFFQRFENLLLSTRSELSIILYFDNQPSRNIIQTIEKTKGVLSVRVREGKEVLKAHFPSEDWKAVEDLMGIKFPYALEIKVDRNISRSALIQHILQKIEKNSDLLHIDSGEDTFLKIDRIINTVRILFLGVMVLFLVGITIIVTGGIRSSIFIHKNEIDVMKLVGATRWFIGSPFILKYTLLTCLFSGAGLILFHSLVPQILYEKGMFFESHISNPFPLRYYLYILLTAFFSSFLSSYNTVKKLI